VYGIPGIRIGWAATQDKRIMEFMVAIREQVTITNNAMSEEIALSVLRRRSELLAKSKTRVERNRAIVSAWIDGQDDFEWIYPVAGVVALPRLKDGISVDPEDIYLGLASKYRTFTIPGRCFEMDNRYFRLGFGADPDEITTGLENISKLMAELKK